MKGSAAFSGFGDYVAGWKAALAPTQAPAPVAETKTGSVDELARLLDALIEHDADLAERLMEKHLGRLALKKRLEARRAAQAPAVAHRKEVELPEPDGFVNAVSPEGEDYDEVYFLEPTVQALLRQHRGPDWSVLNTGAEVAGGLTYAEAMDWLTPERLERGWSAVCVVSKDSAATSDVPVQGSQS